MDPKFLKDANFDMMQIVARLSTMNVNSPQASPFGDMDHAWDLPVVSTMPVAFRLTR